MALYDTLGPETSEFILNHAEVPILVCSIDKASLILDLSPKCPKLKVLIVLDSTPAVMGVGPNNPLTLLKKWGNTLNVRVFSFDEVLALGVKYPSTFKVSKPDDVFCLSYTSGTTGTPKGAMLTHKNMISTVRAAATQMELVPGDVHISYLPLAHIFERMVMLLNIASGGAAGYFRGDGNTFFKF